jgi:predicted ATPase
MVGDNGGTAGRRSYPASAGHHSTAEFAMHLKRITLHPERYPTDHEYPFAIPLFRSFGSLDFESPITCFVGENGTGKSTLLRAIAMKCGIHIWEGLERTRVHNNPHEKELHRYLTPTWVSGPVPGSFFASEIFRNFAMNLDEWAAASPATLDYFGGKSLLEQSHGQCHMSFFRSRFLIKGLYLLDEPENALSPGRQIELLNLLADLGGGGHAQFIIATHSPILLAAPGAELFSFDDAPVRKVRYEDTDHYRVYRAFMLDRKEFLSR